MNIIPLVRNKMLTIAKDAILHEDIVIKQITFLDNSSLVLANMPFYDLVYLGSQTQLKFYSIGGGTVLRTSIILSGTPVRFEILGKPEGEDDPLIVLSGTVGSINTKSDIKFNRINWISGGILTLNNLVLILPNS
jgi:hypothetical protein